MKIKSISLMLSVVMIVVMFSGMGVQKVSAGTGDAKLKIMSFNVMTTGTQPIS